ncbi:hypothetical protein [Saccharothrix sp. HUAS TT1]|uniref:hypothetical protein n=1 Tax=unclassified Saccharothrix TaxID=2593673 RepID=UPI00345B64A3
MTLPLLSSPGSLLTTDGQIEWRGTVLGGLSPYGWDNLEGWYDLPEQRGGNAPLPGYHGSFGGRLVSGERVIVYDWRSKANSLAEFGPAMDTLRRVTAPDEDPVEEELVVRLDGRSLLAWARCDRRIIPTHRHYGLGRANGSLRWVATDPRLYSVEEHAEPVSLGAPGDSGIDFESGGVDFEDGGVDFGGGQQGGSVTVTAGGHVKTWPQLDVIGPTTGPAIVYSGRLLKFDPTFVVHSGQTMTIDTRPGYRTVEIAGVSVRQHLLISQWTPLVPDTPTPIQFTAAYDAASQLVVRWRDAWH